MQAVQAPQRLLLKQILFATDFSATSDRALNFALAMANWYDAKLFIAHAVAPEPRYPVPMDPLPAAMDPDWKKAQSEMARFASTHTLRSIRHEFFVEEGAPWDVVHAIMRTRPMDLLVLGTHGRTGLKKMVLGSAAETIFRQALCPVLTVGPHVTPVDFRTWKLQTIVFPTDFSDSSLAALPFALSLAEEHEAALLMLHLTPLIPIDGQDSMEKALGERLQSLLPGDAENWCHPECLVRFEFPAEGILQLARQRIADLVVMGVRTPAAPQAATHLPWSVATEVVSHAPCPVLTVRG